MMDEAENTDIFRDPDAQSSIIRESLDLVDAYHFDGILLDLEHSVLPTKDATDLITRFVTQFAQEAHARNLHFALALYGDSYYRARPYDVQKLGGLADSVYIMAYDLHKSYGEPGPNFPLNHSDGSSQRYGYSFKTMLADFTQDIPSEKIHILLGLYGYDWSVDDQNRPAKAATARTLSQIQGRFLPRCPFSSCTIFRDPVSTETRITYTDESGQKHTLWFEDLFSVQEKIKEARTYGISHVGFWAYGYY
jgi:spore germination protein